MAAKALRARRAFDHARNRVGRDLIGRQRSEGGLETGDDHRGDQSDRAGLTDRAVAGARRGIVAGRETGARAAVSAADRIDRRDGRDHERQHQRHEPHVSSIPPPNPATLGHVTIVTEFGVLAVSTMLVAYALEDRSPAFVLLFAAA
jgi:hypothetical protein